MPSTPATNAQDAKGPKKGYGRRRGLRYGRAENVNLSVTGVVILYIKEVDADVGDARRQMGKRVLGQRHAVRNRRRASGIDPRKGSQRVEVDPVSGGQDVIKLLIAT